jgi:hypothetical protein
MLSQVAHLLQKIGARCWDPNEDEVERMMRIAANWDPETVGRAELIEMDKHKGEGSDSPEEVSVQYRISAERHVAAFGFIGCILDDCSNGPRSAGLTLSPLQLRKEWNRSVHLLEGLEQAKEMEEQNPDFDTDGAELKRPIHGPEVSFSPGVRSGFRGLELNAW